MFIDGIQVTFEGRVSAKNFITRLVCFCFRKDLKW